MKIEVVREGSVVKLVWTHGYPVHNWTTTFPNHWGNEFDAILMTTQMQGDLQKALTEIRKEAYLEGYNDHKKKIAKKTWWKAIF